MPRTTHNVESVRRANLSLVLRSLHLDGPQSRSDLGARLGLTRSTTGQLVADLASRGLVREGASAPSGTPGRPSPVVAPVAESAVVLAAEVAVDSLAVALVGLGGHMQALARIDHNPDRLGPLETVDDLTRLAADYLEGTPTRQQLIAVSVAVCGVVRRHDGFVHLAPNLGWSDVPLGTMLRERLALTAPVIVANEADLGALAEHGRGAGRGINDMIYLHCEVGIGGGIIVGGYPLEGTAGCAGEVGHLPVNPNGLQCPCGAAGCWETEVGEMALLRHAGRTGGSSRHQKVAAVLADAARGEPIASAAVLTVGRWLGIGMASLVNIFNPELIVLGGVLRDLYPLVETAMREQIRTRAMAPARNFVNIVPAQLGADASLLGAAELALAPLLADPTLMPPRA